MSNHENTSAPENTTAWADHSRHAGLKEECGSCLAADYAKLTAPDDLRRARTAPAQDTYTPGEFGELDPMTYTPGLSSFYSVDAMRADAALHTARTRMVTALPGTPAVEDDELVDHPGEADGFADVELHGWQA